MIIKNLMEDVVFSVVNEILKEEGVNLSEENIQCIVAYILNRVPPKYVTGERGILHGKLISSDLFQQRSDMFFLAYEALKKVNERRKENDNFTENIEASQKLSLQHIIGEVVEITTFNLIYEMEVILLYNRKPARMVDKSWNNPFFTNKGTKGYYHFWPLLEDSMLKENEIPFKLVFKHKKFENKEFDIIVPVVKDFNFAQSKAIPIALFKVKEGEDVSFLYED